MKIKIFDNIDELNEYLDNHKVKDIQWKSFHVATIQDKDNKVFEIVDRWIITEN